MAQHYKQNQHEMFKDNINEANVLRDRKLMERQQRLNEERATIDALNRDIAEEDRLKHAKKAAIRNEQFQEYQNYLKTKYEEQGMGYAKRSKDNISNKIGSENRRLSRKTYDQVNDGLCLNPMKDNNVGMRRNEVSGNNEDYYVGQVQQMRKRGQSHGYNIISNAVYDNSNSNGSGNGVISSTPRNRDAVSNVQNQQQGATMYMQGDGRDYQGQQYAQQQQQYAQSAMMQNKGDDMYQQQLHNMNEQYQPQLQSQLQQPMQDMQQREGEQLYQQQYYNNTPQQQQQQQQPSQHAQQMQLPEQYQYQHQPLQQQDLYYQPSSIRQKGGYIKPQTELEQMPPSSSYNEPQLIKPLSEEPIQHQIPSQPQVPQMQQQQQDKTQSLLKDEDDFFNSLTPEEKEIYLNEYRKQKQQLEQENQILRRQTPQTQKPQPPSYHQEPPKEPELTEDDYKKYYEYMKMLEEQQQQQQQPQLQQDYPKSTPSTDIYNKYLPQQQQQQYTQPQPLIEQQQQQQQQYTQQRPQLQQQQPQPPSHIEPDISTQMHKLSLHEESHNEYLANKQRNNLSFNTLLTAPQKPPTPKYDDKPILYNNKIQQQRQYKEYLDSQINAKKIYRDTVESLTQNALNNAKANLTSQPIQVDNPYKAIRDKHNKFKDIPSNPYSNKNYNYIAGSSMPANPITNPVNSYQFYDRRIPSGRLRDLGTNIVNP